MVTAQHALARLVEGIDADGLAAYGAVVRIGDEEAEHRWRSDDRENLYSVSKGVCAIAAGIAVDEGLITLTTTVPQALPGIELGPGVQDVTFEDLLRMSSGIDFSWFADQPVPWPDLAQEMLGRPTGGPGTAFQYTDASYYVAMRMLAERVGDVRDWLLPRLFGPLAIENPQWDRCPRGAIMAGSGLALRTHELARVGRLLRDGGRWGEVALVDPGWIELMQSWRSTGAPSPFERYGIAGWGGPGRCWRLDGRYGQYVVLDRAADAVVTITAHEEQRDHRLAELAAEVLTG